MNFAVARAVPPLIFDRDILPYKGQISAICRTKQQAADLVHWFGDEDFCPYLPILLCIPGGWGLMAGMGLATASELRDECVARWELMEARLLKTGRRYDFDEARERAGLMRAEDVDAAVRESLLERIRRHRANPITDPPRKLVYPNPTGKSVHTVADPAVWQESNA